MNAKIRRVAIDLVLLFLTACPAVPDDRQLLQTNSGANTDVLLILDSSNSMNHDFSDAFDLPAYMDDFFYPQGTAANTNGSKFGVAKSVLKEIVATTSGVNWAFAYYRNPRQTFGAAATGTSGQAVGGSRWMTDPPLENGGLEWLYFADVIDATSPNSPGAPIGSVFAPDDYPDIQPGRFLQLGHKVMHNYERQTTGEIADIRYPYGLPVGVPGGGGKPMLPDTGFWRGAFGPNPRNGTTSGVVVYRNFQKPSSELRLQVIGGNYGDSKLLLQVEEFAAPPSTPTPPPLPAPGTPCSGIPAGLLAHTLSCFRCAGIPGQQDRSFAWTSLAPYNRNDVVVPKTYNRFAYRTMNSGSSGNTEPAWPAELGSTIDDNGIMWKAEPEILCGVVPDGAGNPAAPPLPLPDRGFDDPQADPNPAFVSTGKRIYVGYKRADTYSLPPLYDTSGGNPPWGSQTAAPDNDADGITDSVSITDRHNRGSYAASFDSDTIFQRSQQFPNDAFAEPSHPLTDSFGTPYSSFHPCNIYAGADCGGIALFDVARTDDASGTAYKPYPEGTAPPAEQYWPVIPFPRDWAPYSGTDHESVTPIQRLLRMASSIVRFDSTQSHMSEYRLAENARNVIVTAPGRPLAGALQNAYDYFKNSVFLETDDPAINCRDYKIVFVTDGMDSASADPCTGGPTGRGPAGDLGAIALPESPAGARALAAAADPTVRTTGIPVSMVVLGTPDPQNHLNELQCIADNSGGAVTYASNRDGLRKALQALLNFKAAANFFASPALPALAGAIGDAALAAGVVPSHVGEDGSFSQWAIWSGSLKSYSLDTHGNIPTIMGGAVAASYPDETRPNDANPTLRRPVWNAARVLGYTNPVANLTEAQAAAVKDGARAPRIKVWPGRKMVWASGSGSTVPLSRQDFLCAATCSDPLTTAMGLDPTVPADRTTAVRTVQFLRGGKTTDGKRDEVLNDLGTYATVTANTKYSYFYRDDQPAPGDPQVRTDGEAAPHGYSHKLGDIFHSEPTVLLPPKYFQFLASNLKPRSGTCGVLSDCSYGKFAALHSKRRKVLFAGANDGFLHAFDAGVWNRDDGGTGAFTNSFDLGTGREIFAYAPSTVMSRKFPNLLAFPPSPQYFVDGSIALADVFIDGAHNGTPAAANRTWKTVLVGTLRQGGRAVFALDVTQPDRIEANGEKKTGVDKDSSPDCLNGGGGNCPASYPAVLWELTDENAPPMGETWSRAVVGRIRILNGGSFEERYVAIFGGGFDPTFTPGQTVVAGDTHRGRAVYIVDVETGKVLYKGTQGKDGGGANVLFAPMPAPPGVADTNDDGYLDVVYIGDVNGRMWKLDLTPSSSASRGVLSGGVLSYRPFLLYDASTSSTQPIQPIFLEPGVIFVSGGSPAKLGVAFGTGNRSALVAPNLRPDPAHPGSTIPFANRFHFVIDDGSGTTLHDTDLVNLTPQGGATTAGTGPAALTNGYFLDFATHNEKAVSTVFSTRGNLSVVTFTPDSSNPCATNGNSYRYRFFFQSGQGGYASAPTGPPGPGRQADYRQYLGRGLAATTQAASPEGDAIETVVFSSGGIIQQNTPGTLKTNSQSWKEQ